MDFAARSLQECFRMLHSLVRQLILVWRQSMRLFGRISRSLVWSLGDDFGLSPFSALSLVRHWIHALRQFTGLFEGSPYSALCLVQQRIQVHASDHGGWFAGYPSPRAVLFVPLVRPMMRCIMAGMDQEYSYVGVAWCPLLSETVAWGLSVPKTVEVPQLLLVQFLEVIDMPVVVHDLCRMIHRRPT